MAAASGALLLVLSAGLRPLAAQPGAGPPPSGAGPIISEVVRDLDGFWRRIGWFGGMAVGFGVVSESAWNTVDCGRCADGPPLGLYAELDVGYRIRRRVAVVVALSVSSHSDWDIEGGGSFDFKTLDTGVYGIGAQYWLSPDVSIRGIVGGGSVTADVQLEDIDLEEAQASGPGALASIDYEFTESNRFSLSVQLDAGALVIEEELVTVFGLLFSARLHSNEPPGRR